MYDDCSCYQGDQSSNAPSIGLVTSTSHYSTDDDCSGYQGDLSFNSLSIESLPTTGFARPFRHDLHPSNGATLLATRELALGVPYGCSKSLAPYSLIEGGCSTIFSTGYLDASVLVVTCAVLCFISPFARHPPPLSLPFGLLVYWVTLPKSSSRGV